MIDDTSRLAWCERVVTAPELSASAKAIGAWLATRKPTGDPWEQCVGEDCGCDSQMFLRDERAEYGYGPGATYVCARVRHSVIAKAVGVSYPTVKRAMADLVAAGLLGRTERRDGSGYGYHLAVNGERLPVVER